MTEPSSDTAEYGFATASELLADIKSGSLSSVELTEALLTRIHELDDSTDGLKSVLAINTNALEHAAAA
ncbi:MAG: hypothetical protein NTW81_04190, partial [Actinobacteria bacterium]|nr:hypothetical protein [Actinomycetota bacterium]